MYPRITVLLIGLIRMDTLEACYNGMMQPSSIFNRIPADDEFQELKTRSLKYAEWFPKGWMHAGEHDRIFGFKQFNRNYFKNPHERFQLPYICKTHNKYKKTQTRENERSTITSFNDILSLLLNANYARRMNASGTTTRPPSTPPPVVEYYEYLVCPHPNTSSHLDTKCCGHDANDQDCCDADAVSRHENKLLQLNAAYATIVMSILVIICIAIPMIIMCIDVKRPDDNMLNRGVLYRRNSPDGIYFNHFNTGRQTDMPPSYSPHEHLAICPHGNIMHNGMSNGPLVMGISAAPQPAITPATMPATTPAMTPATSPATTPATLPIETHATATDAANNTPAPTSPEIIRSTSPASTNTKIHEATPATTHATTPAHAELPAPVHVVTRRTLSPSPGTIHAPVSQVSISHPPIYGRIDTPGSPNRSTSPSSNRMITCIYSKHDLPAN